jgi:hypothetical protein
MERMRLIRDKIDRRVQGLLARLITATECERAQLWSAGLT